MNIIHSSVYDKRHDFGHFLALNSLGWLVLFIDSYRTVSILCSWFYLLDFTLALKISKSLQNSVHRVFEIQIIASFGKRFGSSSGHRNLRQSLVLQMYIVSRICCKRNNSPGLLRWSNLSDLKWCIHLSRSLFSYYKERGRHWHSEFNLNRLENR